MDVRHYEEFKRMIRTVAIAVILCLELLIFWYIWKHYYSSRIYLEPFFNKGDWYLMGLYLLFAFLFMYIYGGLQMGYLKKSNVIYSQALSVICADILMYLLIVLLYRHIAPMYPILLMIILDIICIFICSSVFEQMHQKLFPPRKTLLIYEDIKSEPLFHKINTRRDKYEIFETISVEVGMEKLQEEIKKAEAVIISDVHSPLRNKILKYCYGESIRAYVTPKISDVLIRSSEMLHLFDTPLLLSRNYALTFEQKFVKRFLDIVVSLLLLIIASPFMLVTAIAIKCYDKGPVLFKQKRLTIYGKEFYVYKFRSMITDAEKDGVARLASVNDSRITPVGNVIRKTRLDELPQLINVLRGDMSLVGPRPERPEIADEYERETPEFRFRLKVKAGLTGYAQVYGKYNTTAYDKLKLDLMYIENYSLFADLKLLIVTFKIMFMKESTEGMEENQSIAVSNQGDTLKSKEMEKKDE